MEEMNSIIIKITSNQLFHDQFNNYFLFTFLSPHLSKMNVIVGTMKMKIVQFLCHHL